MFRLQKNMKVEHGGWDNNRESYLFLNEARLPLGIASVYIFILLRENINSKEHCFYSYLLV